MARRSLTTWLCPLCSRVRCEYGELPCHPPDCDQPKHIAGLWYIEHYYGKEKDESTSIGIAEIANSEDEQK